MIKNYIRLIMQMDPLAVPSVFPKVRFWIMYEYKKECNYFF